MRQVIDQLLETRRSNMIGSVVLDGEYGLEDVSLGAPVLVNRSGVQEIERWDLTEEELNGNRKAANHVKNILQHL